MSEGRNVRLPGTVSMRRTRVWTVMLVNQSDCVYFATLLKILEEILRIESSKLMHRLLLQLADCL